MLAPKTLTLLALTTLSWAALSCSSHSVSQPQNMAASCPVQAPPPSSLFGTSYAVVIGISEYKTLNEDLPSALISAETLGKHLESRGVKVLRVFGADATRAHITSLLGHDLPALIEPDDQVLIYFAGHAISTDNGPSFLLPVDASEDNQQASGVSTTELRDWLDSYQAKHVMFIADACYSGAFGTQAQRTPSSTPNYLQVVAKNSSRSFFISGTDGQQANDLDGASVFMKFLLEGLAGEADNSPHDGWVTGSELGQYVSPRVFELSQSKFGMQQQPQYHSEGTGEFLFDTQTKPHQRKPPTQLLALPEVPCLESPNPHALIEDGEDNNNQIVVHDGRSGYVYTYVDSAGSTLSPQSGASGGIFSMADGGSGGSKHALRMFGKLAASNIVYAGMGMNFTDPKDAYDASRYDGITFWAKAGKGTMRKMRVKLPDSNTDPDGGVCSACFNDFGIDLELGEDWKQYRILFHELRQEPGWGAPHPSQINTTKLYGLQFQTPTAGAPYSPTHNAFDFWVDNVAFIDCE